MPLTLPDGTPMFSGHEQWLQEQVNSRHQRNWAKIDRFTTAIRNMIMPAPDQLPSTGVQASAENELNCEEGAEGDAARGGNNWHYDVVGDVILLQSLPSDIERATLGASLLKQVKKASIVAVRKGSLSTEYRCPDGFEIIAGPQRNPLITTHAEFGCRYVIDLDATFFSTRMAAERQRLCSCTTKCERVCVLFAGCGPEVIQVAAKGEVAEVTAIELNPAAVRCLQRSTELLRRSSPESAKRVKIILGDVKKIASELEPQSFDRIIAPRPRGHADDKDGGMDFLRALLPLLSSGGICHWYDFVADWELPGCERSCNKVAEACSEAHLTCKVLRAAVANRNTVAERQYRAVIDFRVQS